MIGARFLLTCLFVLGLTACGEEEVEASPSEAVEEIERPGLPADSVYPFQGLWANSFTDCTLEPGSREEAPILIAQGRFIGYENECTLTDVSLIDEASARYEVTRQCVAEGERYEDSVVFRVLGDTLMMQSDDISVTWTRCPTEPEGE